MHVRDADGECKFWLDPITLANSRGLAPHVVRQIERLVYEHQILLKEKYDEYHRT